MLESFWTISRVNFNKFTHSTIFRSLNHLTTFSVSLYPRIQFICKSSHTLNKLAFFRPSFLVAYARFFSPELISTPYNRKHPHTAGSQETFSSLALFSQRWKFYRFPLHVASTVHLPTNPDDKNTVLFTPSLLSAWFNTPLFIIYRFKPLPLWVFNNRTTLITIQTDFCFLINLLPHPHSLRLPFHIHQL